MLQEDERAALELSKGHVKEQVVVVLCELGVGDDGGARALNRASWAVRLIADPR